MRQERPKTGTKELERLVTAEQDRLFRSAYMRIGNREDAEDVVQDVFLQLFRSNTDLTQIQNLQCYLIRSVHNACTRWQQKKAVDFRPIEDAITVPCPTDDRDIHEEYLRINNLLDQLPSEQAEVLRLKCIDGLKFREIAEFLNIPESTAKSRYRYVIENIHKLLKH